MLCRSVCAAEQTRLHATPNIALSLGGFVAATISTRHYVHGDEKEGTAGTLFYCRACDRFVSGGHFFGECSCHDHYRLFRSELWAWEHAYRTAEYFRPVRVYNIIA